MTRERALEIAREIFDSQVTERQLNDLVDFVSALGLIKFHTKDDDVAAEITEQLQRWRGLRDLPIPVSAIVMYIRELGYNFVRRK